MLFPKVCTNSLNGIIYFLKYCETLYPLSLKGFKEFKRGFYSLFCIESRHIIWRDRE